MEGTHSILAQKLPAHSLWMIEIALALAGLLIVFFVLKAVLKAVRKEDPLKHVWRQNLEKIFLLPLKILLCLTGVFYILHVVGRHAGFEEFTKHLKPFRNAAIVSCLGWVCLRWKKEAFSRAHAKMQHSSPGMVHALNKVLSILIFVLSTLLILQIFELDVMPLLAFSGIGAAAVGFAAKDVISNFLAGLMLSITQPFNEGESIFLPQQNMEGKVESIGWYQTLIRDKDKRCVYLPNALFSNAILVNIERMSHRRINDTISVRYVDFEKIPFITEDIRKVLCAHEGLDVNIKPLVYFNAFKESSLDLFLDAYTNTTIWEEYLRIKEDILQKIYTVLEKHEAKMPFPTLTVEMEF